MRASEAVRHSARATLATASVAVALATAGCAPSDVATVPAEPSPLPPIAVTRGDVVPVLTAAGQVVATPEFAVESPQTGPVAFPADATVGLSVRAGSPVAAVGAATAVSPVDASVTARLVDDGATVAAGVPIVALRYGGLAVSATVPAEDAYRLYAGPTAAVVEIDGGPAGVPCTLVLPRDVGSTDPGAADIGSTGAATGGRPFLCLLPLDTQALPGLSATLGLRTGEHNDVLVLPVSAVAGDAQHGLVDRVVGERTVPTDVGLGLSDGVTVEITSGLDEGDLVLPYGPTLRSGVQ